MKFLHLSDTHILNLKRHDEFKKVFSEIYRIAREQKVDYIIHCGDIAHTKTQISPEFVEMAGDFLRNLGSIAPTYVILGNHDLNLKNDSRIDAISPIINAIGNPNITLLKFSGETKLNDRFTLNVLSLVDKEKWAKPSDQSKINIALFHGSVAGVKTDLGYVIDHADYDLGVLEGHDFAFLGDIHADQILDLEGKVRYAGSTLQNNFGELDDKGFLIWDIEDKDKFTCKHFHIPNPCAFITINLNEDGTLPDFDIAKESRVRIIVSNNVSLEKIKKASDVIKARFKPVSISIVNKSNFTGFGQQQKSELAQEDKNLRDISIQEKLITDYLHDYKADDDVKQSVLDLNKQYNHQLEESEDVLRNIRWKLKSFEWDNLFNYGAGNKINFDNLSGTVGILGKSYSGKSSIIDGLLYTLYNTTSKNNRKNFNIINQNAENAIGKVEIEIEGETYNINRTSDKYYKKLKGVTTAEAKTSVEFTSTGESLNGLARNDTDKNIRRFLGTVDDFLMTSMASQFGSLSFISEGSTKRKEILAKFLDLEVFDKKFKMAKEDSSEIKALLKKLEGIDYSLETVVSEREKINTQAEIERINEEIISENQKLAVIKDKLAKIQEKLSSFKIPDYEYDAVKADLEKSVLLRNNQLFEAEKCNVENTRLTELIEKCSQYLSSIDETKLIKDANTLKELISKSVELEKEISKSQSLVTASKSKLKLLSDIPCGDKYPTCKFVKDAFEAKEKLQSIQDRVDEATKKNLSAIEQRNILEKGVFDLKSKREQILDKRCELEQNKISNELKKEKANASILRIENSIKDLSSKVKYYEDNIEVFKNKDEVYKAKNGLSQELETKTTFIKELETSRSDLYKFEGSLTQKLENINKQQEELKRLRKEYSAYDLFLACMHPSGISYEIIKHKLPAINEEISKVLANVVDFSVFLVNDDDKLEIMIKHPNYDARPLEIGSGAERTLASMAIRLALLQVTTLPISDTLILDEPATALDAENLDGFVRMLDVLKQYFERIILISHLDILKDCVDTQVIITKKEGFAYVNQ